MGQQHDIDGRPARRVPTLDQVAAHAGVGRGTVSRVVNGEDHVSSRARERVMRSIVELGYVPNRAARTLVTRRTDIVALMVSESEDRLFTEPFFAEIVRGIAAAISDASLQLILVMARSPQQRERALEHLTPQMVDGVLLLSLHSGSDLLPTLEARGLPTVVGGRPEVTTAAYVDVDNVFGAEQAVRHLVERGHRHIGTVHGPLDMSAGRDRLDGYRNALVAAGLSVEETLMAGGDFSEASGAAATREILVRRPDIDAVFAASDLMALGAMSALAAHGRSVPEDVAVVGFDDSPGSRLASPRLTSVFQPAEDMGREMVRVLRERLTGASGPWGVLLEPRLVVRESS